MRAGRLLPLPKRLGHSGRRLFCVERCNGFNMAAAPIASLDAAVQRASTILATDPTVAQREAEAILSLHPNDPRALLVYASARRRRGDPQAALAILTPLAAAYPRAAHTQYELGCALAGLNREPEALAALRRAVDLKPDLAEGWRALGRLLFARGDNAAADEAFAAHDRAMIRDPALAPAAEALTRGRPEEAERLLRALLTKQPDGAGGLRLMADALCRLGRHHDGELLLEQALSLEPGHEGARFAYAHALYQQQKAAAAIDALQPLLTKYPSEPAYLNLLAGCLTLLGDLQQAIDIYGAMSNAYPQQAKV